MRAPMLRRLPALVLVLALVAPAAASAQNGAPFGPLPPAQPQQTTTTVAGSSTNSDSGGLKGWQQTLIVVAGLVLLLGIGYAIVADARSVAPVADRLDDEEADGRRPGSRAHAARRKEQSRSKARAARAQRKRNR